MGRIEKCHLLSSHCRYFNKTFIEMFLEKSSISYVCFGSRLIFIGCNGNQNAKKINKKIIISSDIMCSGSLRLYRNIHHKIPSQILWVYFILLIYLFIFIFCL